MAFMRLKNLNAKSGLLSISIYFSTSIIVSAANFASTPLLVKLMGSENFSVWVLLEPVIISVAAVSGLGIQYGLMQKIASGEEGSHSKLNNIWPFYVCAAILISTISSLLIPHITNTSDINISFVTYITTIESIILLVGVVLRAKNNALRSATVDLTKSISLLIILLTPLLINKSTEIMPLSVNQLLIFRIISATLALCIGASIFKLAWRPSISITTAASRYGLPIVIASFISNWLLNVDRYIISPIANPEDITKYVAHTKMAQVLPVTIAGAFFAWFAPKAIKILSDEIIDKRFLSNVTFYFFAGLCVISINYTFFMEYAWKYLFPGLTYDSTLMIVLMVGSLAFAMGNPVSISSLRPGYTHISTIVTLLSLIATAAISLLLAQNWGVLGVAIGRAFGLTTYTALFWIVTCRSLNMSYGLGRFAFVGALVTATAFLCGQMPGVSIFAIIAKLITMNIVFLLFVAAYYRRYMVRV